MAFGADVGVLWKLDGGSSSSFAATRRSSPWPRPRGQPRRLPEAQGCPRQPAGLVRRRRATEAIGDGLGRVRRLGLHASLRIPVVIAGRAEHLIVVSWQTTVSEPDPSTIVLARRFADQAGLALEQLERRKAEADATAYADETRRLQEVTSALSLAASATDVGDTCLEHALSAVGADAGFVVVSRGPGGVLEMVSNSGYSEDELVVWGGFDLDADVPATRTFATGEPVWALTREEMAAFTGVERGHDVGWVTLPLTTTSGGVRAVLQLVFRSDRQLSDGERRWLQVVVSQCAQALERSLLFDEEQRLREHSERLQEMTAALSNAVTRLDVAEVVVEGIEGAMGADATSLAVVQEERSLVRALAWRGYEGDGSRSKPRSTPSFRGRMRSGDTCPTSSAPSKTSGRRSRR